MIANLFYLFLLISSVFPENTEEDGPHFDETVLRDLKLRASPNPFLDPRVRVTFPGVSKVNLAERLGLPWYSFDRDLPRWIYESLPHDDWPESFKKLFAGLPPGFTWNGLGK
ncbi:unnamed protein product, partial [Mesorhabditis belari]|uniref:Uncharacterized protein n=1 Tax=Mesorhabditis belari TaxID=2138241 RepID=A0AAF3EI82_9BILA